MYNMYNIYKNKTSVQGHIDSSFLDSLSIGFLNFSSSEGSFYSTTTTSESSAEEISITLGGLLYVTTSAFLSIFG